MKILLVLPFLLLASCAGKKQSAENRQQAILEEMGRIKAAYFKTVDSLDVLKEKDTSLARQTELMNVLAIADSQKNRLLIPLQSELDSLALKNKHQ